jgi:hypothetical protein
MRAKIIILVMIAGILAVGVLLFTMSGRPGMTGLKPRALPQGNVTPTPSGDQIIGGGVVTAGNTSVAQVQLPAPPSADPEFQKFIAKESKDVDATHIDSEKKRMELAQVIAHLTPVQARQLLQTAQNPGSTAGERILSAYLMIEAGPRAEAELRQLVTSPIPHPEPHETHSEDELRSMQERSVRAMAVDGLIARAEKQPATREALAKTILDIPDPYIKSYAQKRLAEIKPH